MFNLFTKNYSNVNYDEAIKMIANKDTQIIDVREDYEYKAGHIPNSLNIPLGMIPSRLKEIDKSKNIILVCASGARSANGANFLGKNDYKVFNLKGGMMFWTGSISK